MEQTKKTNDTVDCLKEDEPIPGQRTAVISMVEPKYSKLMSNREAFFAANFLQKFFAERKSIEQYITKESNNISVTDLMKENFDFSFENIQKLYYEYLKFNGNTLQQKFDTKYNPQDIMLITGFKVRGVFSNDDLLKQAIKKFHKFEPAVNIYTVPVGKWIPYCPISDENIPQEFAEKQLNNLIKKQKFDVQEEKEKFENKIQNIPKTI